MHFSSVPGLRSALPLAICTLFACTEQQAAPESDRTHSEGPAEATAEADVESGPEAGSKERLADAGDASSPRPNGGGYQGDATVDEAAHAAVTSALARWAELERAQGSTYWYEEENCLVNFKNGWSTFVQVEDGKARVLGTRTFPREQCERVVNRYPMPLGAHTMAELFMLCEREVLGATSQLELASESGLIKSCFYATRSGCKDNCGAGYHLRRWEFGRAPGFQDEPVPGEPACLAYELSWERNGGLVAYSDVNQLRPCASYESKRTQSNLAPPRDLPASRDGGAGCSNEIAPDADVSVEAINAALSHADVAHALERDAGVYGDDPRPVDGQILRVTVQRNGASASATLEIGSECGNRSCTAIPRGLSSLRDLLLKLEAQQQALPGCTLP